MFANIFYIKLSTYAKEKLQEKSTKIFIKKIVIHILLIKLCIKLSETLYIVYNSLFENIVLNLDIKNMHLQGASSIDLLKALNYNGLAYMLV